MNSWRYTETEAQMYGREVLARRVNCYRLVYPKALYRIFLHAFVSLAIALFGEISFGEMVPDGSFM